MNETHLKLLTVIAEAGIADRLTADLAKLGLRGWNTTPGEGAWRGVLTGPGPGDLAGPTLRIETVCPPALAQAVMARLAKSWFPHFAVIAWITDVTVARPAKFRD